MAHTRASLPSSWLPRSLAPASRPGPAGPRPRQRTPKREPPALRSAALSPLRIWAWSSAIVLHLGALAVLPLPAATQLPAPPSIPAQPVLVDIAPRPVLPEPPAPPAPAARPHAPDPAPPQPLPVPTVERSVEFAPSPVTSGVLQDEAPAIAAANDATPASQARASIQYEHATPPPYPALARRRGWEGDVLLQVHVGRDGRPREGVVLRGSGHALLDRSALEHVLARWRFRPAMQGGEAVEAIAQVPIRFRIESI